MDDITSGKLIGACACNISTNLHMWGSHLPSQLQDPDGLAFERANASQSGSCNYKVGDDRFLHAVLSIVLCKVGGTAMHCIIEE